MPTALYMCCSPVIEQLPDKVKLSSDILVKHCSVKKITYSITSLFDKQNNSCKMFDFVVLFCFLYLLNVY